MTFDEPWYYTIELEPGVFTPGAGYTNLGLTRALLARCDVAGRSCLDIGTMDGAVPVLMSRRGAGRIVGVDVAPLDHKIAMVKHYTGARFDYYSGLLHHKTVDFLAERKHTNFDIVVLSGVLYHCFGPLHTLAMARSLVRTGGLMVIETFSVIQGEPAMYFNAGGRFTVDPSTYFLPSWSLLDYVFRYFKLERLDRVSGPENRIDDHRCARVAYVCRAVADPLPDPDDTWMAPATNIVDYLTLFNWNLVADHSADPVGYTPDPRFVEPMLLPPEVAVLRLTDIT